VGDGARDGVGGAPVARRVNRVKLNGVGSSAKLLAMAALLSSGV